MDRTAPRRWLLISREMGVPDDERSGDRWSLDHLFLDQDGIPTLIEVKRSSDTRIRREVVGQMLDYAANALTYWPVETIRAKFEARCENEQIDPEQALGEFFGVDSDQEALWQKVKTNLQAGKVRMAFVADKAPSELKRVIEFLLQGHLLTMQSCAKRSEDASTRSFQSSWWRMFYLATPAFHSAPWKMKPPTANSLRRWNGCYSR